MVPDKSPATDGLPSEFYKVFWNDVADILVNSFNYSYEIGKLSISQRRGIIKFKPKKDANLNSIRNWRPLTLLNCDYKKATKAKETPLEPVIALGLRPDGSKNKLQINFSCLNAK